jgi:chaperonin cofactor prefoldin
MSSASLKAEMAARQSEAKIVDDKIERLREAKNQLKNIENEIEGLRNGVKKQADQGDTWAGSNYEKYKSYTTDTFVGMDYRNYLNRLDQSIQAIENKIRELNSQRWDLGNTITWLIGAIANAIAEEAAAAARAAAAAAAAAQGR